jgi:hypothetical protein
VCGERTTSFENVCPHRCVGHNEAVTYWKPHALAKPHADQLDLKIGDHVTATTDLHGVPVGSEGRVLLANGFNWQRYRVLFNNGVEIGDLDGRQLVASGKTAKRLAKAAAKKR